MNSSSEEDIDYKPKMLLREIGNLPSGKDFHLKELAHPGIKTDSYDLKGKFFEIICNENKIYTAYVGRVNCCRSGGCSNLVTIDFNGEFEYFDYFILFDSQNRIITTRVYNYEATHGAEITAKGWLNQFSGYDGTKNLRIGKEVDSISGATISVFGMVTDVQGKTAMLNRIRPTDKM
jgi:Na+-translocating ferredoxin:NAD+ oxidoreductase RnfG subunit